MCHVILQRGPWPERSLLPAPQRPSHHLGAPFGRQDERWGRVNWVTLEDMFYYAQWEISLLDV